MSNILRKASEIREASMSDLVATYNAYADKPVKKFENRAVAERRVEMILLSAKDRAAHAGVPKGAEPQPITNAEAAAKKGPVEPAKRAEAPAEPEAQANPYPAGSRRAALWEEMRGKAKPTPRPTPEKRPPGEGRRSTVTHVRLTGRGISKLQAASARATVFDGVTALAARAADGVVAMDDLAAHCGMDVRGHIQKLIVVDHVEPVARPAAKGEAA